MADGPEKDEKTEEATPRRLEDAREKGQVAFSSEVMAATSLVTAALGIAIFGGALARASASLLTGSLAELGGSTAELELADLSDRMVVSVKHVMPQFLLFLAPTVLVGWIVAYAQVGVRIAPKAVAPDASKLSPAKGMGRIFSARSAMRTGLAVLKLATIAAVVLGTAYSQLPAATSLVAVDVRPGLAVLGGVLGRAALAGVAAVLVLSLFDLLFQRFQHKRDLRMTRKELKDEFKNTEGDPHVKSRIRRLQRELASRRMMEDVPDATVVVTNPEHYAVALKYDASDGRPPVVVAKGVDEVAQNIKRVAREAGVPIHRDPPLARALHRQVEIGGEIPEGLFQAVAGVLAYVYRIQGRTHEGAAGAGVN